MSRPIHTSQEFHNFGRFDSPTYPFFFIKCPKWLHPIINILISNIKRYAQFHEFLKFEIVFFAHLHILSADCQCVEFYTLITNS